MVAVSRLLCLAVVVVVYFIAAVIAPPILYTLQSHNSPRRAAVLRQRAAVTAYRVASPAPAAASTAAIPGGAAASAAAAGAEGLKAVTGAQQPSEVPAVVAEKLKKEVFTPAELPPEELVEGFAQARVQLASDCTHRKTALSRTGPPCMSKYVRAAPQRTARGLGRASVI